MQFISLWCVNGCDNGLRSAVISGVIYCLVLLLSLLLGPSIWLYLVGLLLVPVLLFSVRRRLRDANCPGQWVWLSLLPFIGVIVTLANIENEVLLLFFIILAVCITLYFCSLKAVVTRVYVQGYHGPDMKVQRGMSGLSQQRNGKKRVEPTLSSHLQKNTQYEESLQRDLTSENDIEEANIRPQKIDVTKEGDLGIEDASVALSRARTDHGLDIESSESAYHNGNQHANVNESIKEKLAEMIKTVTVVSVTIINRACSLVLQTDKRILAGVGGAGFALVLLAFILFSGGTENPAPLSATSSSLPEASIVRHEAKLPDGFSLVFEDSVLIMRWLGETQEPQALWSLASAQGDDSCAVLTFNNGAKYRPLSVAVLPDTAIEARFSPLDNAGIITDVAKRGSVSLCGYKFSLKGSLAVLGKNPIFGDYL